LEAKTNQFEFRDITYFPLLLLFFFIFPIAVAVSDGRAERRKAI
jgi:hypothetical protein